MGYVIVGLPALIFVVGFYFFISTMVEKSQSLDEKEILQEKMLGLAFSLCFMTVGAGLATILVFFKIYGL